MIGLLRKLFQKKKGYYFIHIPKTAGTSFINVLDAQVDYDEILPCQLWREINQNVVNNKYMYQLVRGHFGGGSFHQLTSNNPHLLTILRHPRSLSISTYHFIQREDQTAVHDLAKDMSLKDFLTHPETIQKINNRMVRHLSFDLKEDPEGQELFLSEQSIKVVNQWIEKGVNLNNQQRLARAKKRLDDCSWLAIQEKLQESMQLFAYRFNLPPILELPYLNAYKPNKKISNDCLELIDQQNHYDLQLYQYGLQKFNQQYQEMLSKLESLRSSCNQSIDDLIDLNYQKNNDLEVRSSVDFSFDQALTGSGWHRRELAMPEESYFRWTNHPCSYLDFCLHKKDYKLSIRIINAISEELLNQLVLKINKQVIDYKTDTKTGVVRILSAKINAQMITQQPLRIEFQQQELAQHSKVFNTDDDRLLGIAVHWIKIQP